MILGFDTETTGLPNSKKPMNDPCQPSLMQISVQVYSNEWTLLHEWTSIVRPVKEPDAKAVETHGITKKLADDVGISEPLAITIFSRFLSLAPRWNVAHNRQFDFQILEMCALRHGLTIDWGDPSRGFCTCEGMGPIMLLPPTEPMRKWRPDLKWKNPNLDEALQFTHGREVEGAHDAGADTKACLDVFRWMLEGGHVE